MLSPYFFLWILSRAQTSQFLIFHVFCRHKLKFNFFFPFDDGNEIVLLSAIIDEPWIMRHVFTEFIFWKLFDVASKLFQRKNVFHGFSVLRKLHSFRHFPRNFGSLTALLDGYIEMNLFEMSQDRQGNVSFGMRTG